MAEYDPNSQKLRQLFEALNEDETAAARQLLGISLFLGSPGLAVLRHFLDSLLLFGLGRLLVLFLERIGMPAGEIELIHTCSKWYEIALFVSFAVFSLIDIFRAKFSGEPARPAGDRMKAQRILKSGFGSRLMSALLFAGMGAALERAGWAGSAILWVVVVGSVGLGVLRRIYGFQPPLATPRVMKAGV